MSKNKNTSPMNITKLIAIFLISFFIIPSFSLATRGDISLNSLQEILTGSPSKKEVLDLIKRIELEIKSDPSGYTNYEMLALAYDYLGLSEKALEVIKQEIKYYPEDGDNLDVLYGNLARQYINLEKLDEAKLAIDKALGYNPGNIVNHIHLLNYYILKGQYKEVGSELKIMSNLDVKYDFYGDIYQYAVDKVKNKDDLITIFKAAVNTNPNNAFAHRALAMAMKDNAYLNHTIDKVYLEVLEEYKKALELNQTYIPVYIGISNTYLFMGSEAKDKTFFKQAMKWLKKAAKIEPGNLKVVYAMGNLFYCTEEYDKAISKMKFLLDKNFVDEHVINILVSSYNNKAFSFYKKGRDFKKGLEIIEKALKLRPADRYVLSTKAELLYGMKRFDEAEEYMKRLVETNPDPEFLSCLGFEQQGLGNYNLAKRYYTESLKLNSENFKVICNLGLIYTRQREYNKAIECYQKFILLQPDDFRGYYNLGIAYHNIGDKVNAFKQVNKLREIKEYIYADELKKTINLGEIADGKERFIFDLEKQN